MLRHIAVRSDRQELICSNELNYSFAEMVFTQKIRSNPRLASSGCLHSDSIVDYVQFNMMVTDEVVARSGISSMLVDPFFNLGSYLIPAKSLNSTPFFSRVWSFFCSPAIIKIGADGFEQWGFQPKRPQSRCSGAKWSNAVDFIDIIFLIME